MLELLRSIPGPQFLIFFPLLVIAAIILGRLINNASPSGLRMPEPSSFPPATIASLRGNWELVLKTIIFGLWQKGAIELVPDPEADAGRVIRILGKELSIGSGKGTGMLLRRADGAVMPTDRMEMAVWKFLVSERKPDAFFKDATLQSFVQTAVKQSYMELERKGLLKSADQVRRGWIVFSIIMVTVLGTGITKFVLGIMHGRPAGFLLLMLPAAVIALAVAMNPAEKLTPMGKQFLKRLEEHFAWLKDAVKGNEKPGIDPAYAFAIFGTTVLAGTLLYATFSEAFPGQTSGGCGGGSCGGSSCSGGGCSGGGGCGGCGGGD